MSSKSPRAMAVQGFRSQRYPPPSRVFWTDPATGRKVKREKQGFTQNSFLAPLSLLQEFLGDFIVEQANQAPQEQVGTIPLAGQPQLAPEPQKKPLERTPQPLNFPKEHRQPQQNRHHLPDPGKPPHLEGFKPQPLFKSRKNRSTSHRLRYASTTRAASSLPLTGKLVSSHHSPRRPRAGTRQTTRWSRLPSTSTSLHPEVEPHPLVPAP